MPTQCKTSTCSCVCGGKSVRLDDRQIGIRIPRIQINKTEGRGRLRSPLFLSLWFDPLSGTWWNASWPSWVWLLLARETDMVGQIPVQVGRIEDIKMEGVQFGNHGTFQCAHLSLSFHLKWYIKHSTTLISKDNLQMVCLSRFRLLLVQELLTPGCKLFRHSFRGTLFL